MREKLTPLTRDHKERLNEIDKRGRITEADREFFAGRDLHFCDDWDELAICKGCPEYEYCTCIKEHTE